MEREARKGANEAWFRALNERLEDRAVEKRQSDRFEIVCECAVEECTDRIEITYIDYEAVRTEARQFIVMPGHVDPSLERVVSSGPVFLVVEKFGDAGEIAEIENRRDGNAD
jgi:hypothetical protein